MGAHRQTVIILLTYFLLSACLCSQPTRSRRQKRGLVKMMMHIMWDPVRLIRYWYAYDVTKEIAKSWRKIIPTILLLPVTQNRPHSYQGIAKYVHPTIGVRDSAKKNTYLKYYSIPNGQHYYKSGGHMKPVAIPPDVLHQVLPSRYSYSPQQSHDPYYLSSKETSNRHHYKQKSIPQVIVGHAPLDDNAENGNQHSVAHYFIGEDNSREQISTSSEDIFFPGQTFHDSHDDIRSSSSQNVPSKNLNKRPVHGFQNLLEEGRIHYMPHAHASIDQERSEQKASHILHPGQEFHIVLHPIPVSDFNPDSLQPPSDGHSIQFVPVHPPGNESHGVQIATAPLLFKAVSTGSAESFAAHEDVSDSTATDRPNSSEVNKESEENNKYTYKNSSTNAKSPVTWIANPSRRKDKEGMDLQSDGTVARVSSVLKADVKKYKFKKDDSDESSYDRKSNGLNRHNINMERLREDLKHGTPVLIPFNKNVYSPEYASNNNPGRFQQANKYVVPNAENAQEKLSVKLTDAAEGNSSAEQSGERNATQRYVLFLKKQKRP